MNDADTNSGEMDDLDEGPLADSNVQQLIVVGRAPGYWVADRGEEKVGSDTIGGVVSAVVDWLNGMAPLILREELLQQERDMAAGEEPQVPVELLNEGEIGPVRDALPPTDIGPDLPMDHILETIGAIGGLKIIKEQYGRENPTAGTSMDARGDQPPPFYDGLVAGLMNTLALLHVVNQKMKERGGDTTALRMLRVMLKQLIGGAVFAREKVVGPYFKEAERNV